MAETVNVLVSGFGFSPLAPLPSKDQLFKHKPFPDEAPTIFGFKDEVEVLSSLQVCCAVLCACVRACAAG